MALRPGALEQRLKDQAQALQSAARYVKAGGRLVYATCSLLIEENEGQIDAFITARPEFSAVAGADGSAPICLIWLASHRRMAPRPAVLAGDEWDGWIFHRGLAKERGLRARRKIMTADFHHDIAERHDKVLIVDFGSQVTQLIARRVREAGAYCEIHPFNRDPAQIAAFGAKGIILSGGPCSVTETDSPRAPQVVFELGVPVLGICYGQQTMCVQLGGKVEAGHDREFGKAVVTVTAPSALGEGVWEQGKGYQVWMSHGDRVVSLPPGFHAAAVSEGAPFAMIADEQRRLYATQFHLEVVHTPEGARLIGNFVHNICGCGNDWSMGAFRAEEIRRIRAKVGNGRVICGLSGGVDSAVAAVLIHEAIGSQLTCIFVDTGLMRAGEAEEVVTLFRRHYNIPLVAVDAERDFLDALAGVTDPEQKRKIIGGKFIDVFEAEASKTWRRRIFWRRAPCIPM